MGSPGGLQPMETPTQACQPGQNKNMKREGNEGMKEEGRDREKIMKKHSYQRQVGR